MSNGRGMPFGDDFGASKTVLKWLAEFVTTREYEVDDLFRFR